MIIFSTFSCPGGATVQAGLQAPHDTTASPIAPIEAPAGSEHRSEMTGLGSRLCRKTPPLNSWKLLYSNNNIICECEATEYNKTIIIFSAFFTPVGNGVCPGCRCSYDRTLTRPRGHIGLEARTLQPYAEFIMDGCYVCAPKRRRSCIRMCSVFNVCVSVSTAGCSCRLPAAAAGCVPSQSSGPEPPQQQGFYFCRYPGTVPAVQ